MPNRSATARWVNIKVSQIHRQQVPSPETLRKGMRVVVAGRLFH